MAPIVSFARTIAGFALAATVLMANGAGADGPGFEDSDDRTQATHSLDSVRHTEGESLDAVDRGTTETLGSVDVGQTVTLDAADSGKTTDLDAADTGHTVSLDAAEAGDRW